MGSALVAKEFLKTTTWLSSRATKEPVADEDIQELADLLTSTLIGLKNETPAAITLRKHFRRGSTFIVSTGFPTFIRELLKVLFPTLRHRLFRNYQDAYNVTNFVWGDTRAWIEDREKDIRACDEWIIAIAMSQHPRLGRNSWLFRLDKELIIAIVKPLR